VSTAQFMTAVHVEEPKEFSGCPRQRMMQTEDGVTSGSEIKKTREMDQDFRTQINDDKIYTCEKHFDPEEIEIC